MVIKVKIKGSNRDLKIKKKRMIIKIVKIYLGLSLVLLWAVWSQFIFGYFLGLAYVFKIYRPLPM